MITVLDYGLGNVGAFVDAYDRMGVRCTVARSPADVLPRSNLVLPGVGAFDRAMERLHDTGLGQATREVAARGEAAILGVCVGMQVLFDRSDEGQRDGLGLIPGCVRSLHVPEKPGGPCLPHLGWNQVRCGRSHPITEGIDGQDFYFLHSYRALPANEDHVLGSTHYGLPFASIVGRASVFGVQFHPEKSHSSGTRLLHNFASYRPA